MLRAQYCRFHQLLIFLLFYYNGSTTCLHQCPTITASRQNRFWYSCNALGYSELAPERNRRLFPVQPPSGSRHIEGHSLPHDFGAGRQKAPCFFAYSRLRCRLHRSHEPYCPPLHLYRFGDHSSHKTWANTGRCPSPLKQRTLENHMVRGCVNFRFR